VTTKSSIQVPSAGGVGKSLGNYGVGLIAGIGYRLISTFTGSGLIGGAIAAAVTGAMVKGPAGEIIAVNAGFLSGQATNLLGGGGLLGGLLGGGGGNGGGNDQGLDAI